MSVDPKHGIRTVDAHFVKPGFAASYLISEGNRAAFIDTGTTYSIPLLMQALRRNGLAPEQVQYVILTHIHLDHAGGASALMDACPHAQLVVHQRGVRHMVDPSKLITGTYEVFGKERARKLYGEIQAIDPGRIVSVQHSMDLDLNGRRLHLFDSPGHARHHLAIWDDASRGIFTGDCFGLSYRVFDTEKGAFTFPTTTPVHFDPEAMHHTLDTCMAFNPQWIYPTHFGPVGDVPRQAERMHRLIDSLVTLTRTLGPEKEKRTARMQDGMAEILFSELKKHGYRGDLTSCLPWLKVDLNLNTQGLLFWWDHVVKG